MGRVSQHAFRQCVLNNHQCYMLCCNYSFTNISIENGFCGKTVAQCVYSLRRFLTYRLVVASGCQIKRCVVI